jgi:hypothetical protein
MLTLAFLTSPLGSLDKQQNEWHRCDAGEPIGPIRRDEEVEERASKSKRYRESPEDAIDDTDGSMRDRHYRLLSRRGA